MKDTEKERVRAKRHREPQELIVGLDALAVYVHKDNPLDSISIEELAEIYGEGGRSPAGRSWASTPSGWAMIRSSVSAGRTVRGPTTISARR